MSSGDAQRITMDQLAGSPACIPQMTMEEIFTAYRELGFRKFEAFGSWCRSHLDITQDPQGYLDIARRFDMRFTSMHLPRLTEDLSVSLDQAVRAARFAAAVGATVVLYKADSRENYIRGAGPFLDTLEREAIAVTPVLQNHKGTPITTLEDYRAVIEGIDDPRMKTLLEVGHFQRVGVHWRDGYDLLGDSIALVHINDIDASGQSVPFGAGEVDFPGLFEHLSRIGYRGEIVVELELATRDHDADRTVHYLGESLDYLRRHCLAEAPAP